MTSCIICDTFGKTKNILLLPKCHTLFRFQVFPHSSFSVPGSNLVYHIALRNHNKGKKVKYEKIKDDVVPSLHS